VSAQPDAAARLRVEPSVVRDLVRLAALDVPGVVRVGRGGPRIVRRLAADPVAVQVRDGRADVRLRITAAAGSSLPALARDVRTAAAGAVERLLGLDAADVTVIVERVEASAVAGRAGVRSRTSPSGRP